jgi:hypothetical protein
VAAVLATVAAAAVVRVLVKVVSPFLVGTLVVATTADGYRASRMPMMLASSRRASEREQIVVDEVALRGEQAV